MILFDNFQVSVADRQLRRDGRVLVLRERAFEVLLALLEQAGAVVSKRELCRRAWPGRDVEENNLQVEILGLRKALGRHAIVTAPGRGYQFALRVETAVPAMSGEIAPTLAGRDEDMRALEALLAPGVLVTLSGEGGIGKTQLAQMLARRLQATSPDGACVVALDTAQGSDQAWRSVADALHLPADGGRDHARALGSALRERRLLLVLDGCERHLQEVAELASVIVRECPGISLLATSREALRVPGERVYRLGPLALGSAAESAPATECAAVRLFLQIHSANAAAAVRADANPATVLEICRRLEGNPLAIKLAARRAGELGVKTLRRRLAERLDLLADPDPGAPARQHSLRASLVWDYQLLSALERSVFGELAALPQPFTLAQLLALKRRSAPDPWDIMEALARLVDKSLIAIDHADPPNYRLPETTMLYAQEVRKASQAC